MSVAGLSYIICIFCGVPMPLKIVHTIFFPEICRLCLETEFYGLCFWSVQKVAWFAQYMNGAHAM